MAENTLTSNQILEALSKMLSEETISGGTGSNPQANNSGVPTDENLSLPEIYHQLASPSLARSVLHVQKLHGPTGALFNIKKKDAEDAIELLRNDVEVYPSEPIKTGITQEVLDDIFAQYGQNGLYNVAVLLRGLANNAENDKLFEWLEDVAVDTSRALTLSNQTNAIDNFYELNQFVSEEVLKMNLAGVRTYRASVILPYKLAASVLGVNGVLSTGNATKSEFYVGGTSFVKYFVHTDPAATNGYIILHDEILPTSSAGVISPYQDQLQLVQNSEDGQYNVLIYNRFAIKESPLHTASNPMITKFVSPL